MNSFTKFRITFLLVVLLSVLGSWPAMATWSVGGQLYFAASESEIILGYISNMNVTLPTGKLAGGIPVTGEPVQVTKGSKIEICVILDRGIEEEDLHYLKGSLVSANHSYELVWQREMDPTTGLPGLSGKFSGDTFGMEAGLYTFLLEASYEGKITKFWFFFLSWESKKEKTQNTALYQVNVVDPSITYTPEEEQMMAYMGNLYRPDGGGYIMTYRYMPGTVSGDGSYNKPMMQMDQQESGSATPVPANFSENDAKSIMEIEVPVAGGNYLPVKAFEGAFIVCCKDSSVQSVPIGYAEDKMTELKLYRDLGTGWGLQVLPEMKPGTKFFIGSMSYQYPKKGQFMFAPYQI
ncbi:MAG: hypothetical protein WC570_03180 [Patescibacteria group bacterium]